MFDPLRSYSGVAAVDGAGKAQMCVMSALYLDIPSLELAKVILFVHQAGLLCSFQRLFLCQGRNSQVWCWLT